MVMCGYMYGGYLNAANLKLMGVSRAFNSLHNGEFFRLLLSSDDFSKLTFSKNSIRHIRVSNGLDPDQDQHFVGSDLGSNCLQRLLTDNKSCQ